jgi:hypothetical protein
MLSLTALFIELIVIVLLYLGPFLAFLGLKEGLEHIDGYVCLLIDIKTPIAVKVNLVTFSTKIEDNIPVDMPKE